MELRTACPAPRPPTVHSARGTNVVQGGVGPAACPLLGSTPQLSPQAGTGASTLQPPPVRDLEQSEEGAPEGTGGGRAASAL